MPFNGSGSFSAPGASFPAVSGALIESAKYNAVVNDIATGLSTAIAKDGQTTITGNLPMAGYRHTGVGNAAARDSYAAAGQIQDSGLTWAGTAGGTGDAITLTLTPAIAAYATGQEFTYKAGASANTTAMTVNINGLGTKAIQKNGQAMASGDHPANVQFRIRYDGTAFQVEQVFQPSGFMLTVLDDTTAAAARTTLGVAYGPSFSAYAASSQSVVTATATLVTLGTEESDTATCFASNKFTPNVAGYYHITGHVRGQSTTLTAVTAAIYKNGTIFRTGDFDVFSSISSAKGVTVDCLVSLNGSTDYIELYGTISGGTPTFEFIDSARTSYLCGYLARPL